MHPDDVRLSKARRAERNEGELRCSCGAEVIEPGKQMPGDAGQFQSGRTVRPLWIFLSACRAGHDVTWKET